MTLDLNRQYDMNSMLFVDDRHDTPTDGSSSSGPDQQNEP